MTRQIKSKERVADHGEVFTNEKEVKAMCDLVKQETERIDSRFLEPACGDGNFLIEILKRKLEIVKKKYKKSHYDYERYSLLALGSVYGVELLEDKEKMYELQQKFLQMFDIAGMHIYDVLKIDGAKFYLGEEKLSWVLMRPSGTEPLLRFYIESDSIETLDKIKDFIRSHTS